VSTDTRHGYISVHSTPVGCTDTYNTCVGRHRQSCGASNTLQPASSTQTMGQTLTAPLVTQTDPDSSGDVTQEQTHCETPDKSGDLNVPAGRMYHSTSSADTPHVPSPHLIPPFPSEPFPPTPSTSPQHLTLAPLSPLLILVLACCYPPFLSKSPIQVAPPHPPRAHLHGVDHVWQVLGPRCRDTNKHSSTWQDMLSSQSTMSIHHTLCHFHSHSILLLGADGQGITHVTLTPSPRPNTGHSCLKQPSPHNSAPCCRHPLCWIGSSKHPPSVLGLATHTTAEQPHPLTLDRVVHCLQALLGDATIVPQHTPVVVVVAFG
jgi:hypothetical protein